ncbi:MAG: M48 family metallopeptidase, partial [Verrucomicrobiota bacterium]
PVILKCRVVSDNSFNATCMVGGRMTVNTGVLDVTRNDDELAFVIAHEVGHAVARHVGETITRESMRSIGLDFAAFVADWAERQRHIQKGTVTNILAGLDVATILTSAYPHRREQEFEADYLGLMLMAGAGFRPEAAVDLWRRVASSRSDPGSSIARAVAKYCGTHPPDSARIAQLQAALPDARRFLRTER